MMDIFDRLEVWRKLAQIATDPDTAPKTTLGPAPQITLTQIPNYKVQLFAKKPEFAEDIEKIFNIFNKYLWSLSGGKLEVSGTWKAPSVGGSAFTNSIKNIYKLSKWLYSTISLNDQPYSIEGLKKIVQDLKNTVIGLDFPDPTATQFKTDIINICQVMSNKLGT